MKKQAIGLMSSQAKDLYNELSKLESKYVDFNDMKSLRLSIDKDSRQNSKNALAKFQCDIQDIHIYNTKVMKITPKSALKDRTILYLFGGGFTTGCPFNDLPITAHIANSTRATILCPYYPLAPEHPFPAAISDLFSFAKSIWKNEPCPPLLLGESAGATLALSLTHLLQDNRMAMPKCMGLLSPAADVFNEGDSSRFYQNQDPSLTLESTELVVQAYAGTADPTDPILSPIHGKFNSSYPKTLITSGTRDFLLSSSTRLSRVMREAGVDVELRVWEGMWHVFEYYPQIPEAAASLEEMSSFLNSGF